MTLEDPGERAARGRALQTETLAAPAPEPETLLDSSWRDFIFAEVWTRPALDRRSRLLISIASAASASTPPAIIDGYVKGALTQGLLTLTELREAALHFAVYGGWSRGALFDAAVTRVASALGLEPAAFDPIRAKPWDPMVRRAEGNANFEAVMTFGGPPPVTAYFDAGIINFVFGEVWMRPGLDQRARRWITLVGVADSASDTPIRTHIYAAMASGNASVAEMHEFALQYAIHSGWPRASVVQTMIIDMAKRIESGLSFA